MSTSTATNFAATAVTETTPDYYDPRFPKWLSVVLFVVGLFGNLLSFLVFRRKSMKKNATFVYLAYLSLVDSLVLVFGLGDIIILSYFKYSVRYYSLAVCRSHTFFTYTFTHMSSFILAAVSVDRAIASNCLQLAKSYCRPRTAHRVLLGLVLFTVAVNFHSLLFLGYRAAAGAAPSDSTDAFFSSTADNTSLLHLNSATSENSTMKMNIQRLSGWDHFVDEMASVAAAHSDFLCESRNGTLYDLFLEPYFEWIDLVLYAIAPFFIMVVCSYLVIRVVFVTRANLRTPKTPPGVAASHRLVLSSPASNLSQPTSSKSPTAIVATTVDVASASTYMLNVIKRNHRRRVNKTLHLTYTLISINALFFLLVSPLVLVLVFSSGKEHLLSNKLLINIVYLLAYANHSFNFLFYGLSSPPFRESVAELFRLRAARASPVRRLNRKRHVERLRVPDEQD